MKINLVISHGANDLLNHFAKELDFSGRIRSGRKPTGDFVTKLVPLTRETRFEYNFPKVLNLLERANIKPGTPYHGAAGLISLIAESLINSKEDIGIPKKDYLEYLDLLKAEEPEAGRDTRTIISFLLHEFIQAARAV